MIIPSTDFLHKFKELYVTKTPYMATLAYWMMIHLIEDGESFYLPEYDCYYMIRDKHLLVYYSPDNQLHLSIGELNSLDCISLPAHIYDSVKEQLVGFNPSYDWKLQYDFNYHPIENDLSPYEAVDFNFADQQHYDKAAAIICDGDEHAFNEKRVKKMTLFPAFDPSLWFFAKDKVTQELAAISISTYDIEVKQTDLDWIFVASEYQGKGCGRFIIEETIRRCKDKSEDIRVAGEVDFYRRCGFVNSELWVWARKDGYQFKATSITP